MQSKKLIHPVSSLVCLTLVASLMGGCASNEKSMGIGALLGTGAGAALGGIAAPGKNGKYRTRNVIIGAAAGGIAGTVAGAALFENTERQKELAYLKGRESKDTPAKGNVPELQEPKVEAQWVETKVQGNKWIEGHYEYVIKEPVRWEVGHR